MKSSKSVKDTQLTCLISDISQVKQKKLLLDKQSSLVQKQEQETNQKKQEVKRKQGLVREALDKVETQETELFNLSIQQAHQIKAITQELQSVKAKLYMKDQAMQQGQASLIQLQEETKNAKGEAKRMNQELAIMHDKKQAIVHRINELCQEHTDSQNKHDKLMRRDAQKVTTNQEECATLQQIYDTACLVVKKRETKLLQTTDQLQKQQVLSTQTKNQLASEMSRVQSIQKQLELQKEEVSDVDTQLAHRRTAIKLSESTLTEDLERKKARLDQLEEEEQNLKKLCELQDKESQACDQQMIDQANAEQAMFKHDMQVEQMAQELHETTKKRLEMLEYLQSLKAKHDGGHQESTIMEIAEASTLVNRQDLPLQGYQLSTRELERCIDESRLRQQKQQSRGGSRRKTSRSKTPQKSTNLNLEQ